MLVSIVVKDLTEGIGTSHDRDVGRILCFELFEVFDGIDEAIPTMNPTNRNAVRVVHCVISHGTLGHRTILWPSVGVGQVVTRLLLRRVCHRFLR